MKLFIDTANIDEIKEMNDWGIIDGVTTNPSLAAKEGRTTEDVIQEIVNIVDGPISAEVISTEADKMIAEGRELAKIHDNVVIKIPLIAEGLKATKVLSDEGINVNVTLCFSSTQALLAAKAGAYFISPFVGRLDDISTNGMELISQIRQIYNNYGFETQILTASVRHPIHVMEAALIGSDIATCPTKVLRQIVKHPLTDKGLEQFLKDYEKVSK